MDLWHIERGLIAEGYVTICGIDEAGRGPLAGPVFAAAVILPFGVCITGLNDSKKVSVTMRERLFGEIVEKSIAYGIGMADNKEVDDINILNATFLAMKRAVNNLAIQPDIALVDGNRDPYLGIPSMCIVCGDGKSASIAAASILAKVSRDAFMAKIAEKYPQYGFDKHKGYGTKYHYDKLREFGPSEIHRATFLKNKH
jgi:ribonuclease HII